MEKVRVLGGGFTGTLTALMLHRAGYSVELLERGPRWGGVIGTEHTQGGPFEWAAHGFLSSRLLEDIASTIGVELIPTSPRARRRYIFWQSIRRWPLSAFETLQTILHLLYHLATRQAAPKENESLRDWGRRVLGSCFTQAVLRVSVLGIYAAPIEQLSANLIVGRFFKISRRERRSRRGRLRGTVAPRGGMEEWIAKVVQHLEKSGAVVRLNQTFELQLNDPVPTIVCVHVKDLPSVLCPVDTAWAEAFVSVKAPTVVSCMLSFKPNEEDLHGYGMLFHPEAGFHALGCLFESDCFLTEPSLRRERYILSEMFLPELSQLTDAAIVEKTLSDHRRFGQDQVLLSTSVRRTKPGIPIYNVELEQLLESTPIRKHNIFINGNFLGALGLSQIAQQTADLVNTLQAKLTVGP